MKLFNISSYYYAFLGMAFFSLSLSSCGGGSALDPVADAKQICSCASQFQAVDDWVSQTPDTLTQEQMDLATMENLRAELTSCMGLSQEEMQNKSKDLAGMDQDEKNWYNKKFKETITQECEGMVPVLGI